MKQGIRILRNSLRTGGWKQDDDGILSSPDFPTVELRLHGTGGLRLVLNPVWVGLTRNECQVLACAYHDGLLASVLPKGGPK